MIKHLLKLVWKRKRANGLLIAEIFFAFLVLFAVSTLVVYYAQNYRQPLGFAYQDVWTIDVGMRVHGDDSWNPQMVETAEQLFLSIRDLPPVESLAGIMAVPFGLTQNNTFFRHNNRQVLTTTNEVTDEMDEVLRIDLVRGRWFDRSDDAANERPLVINTLLARELFGDEDPIGQRITFDYSDAVPMRVIGVVSDFRQKGEYAGLEPYALQRKRLGNPEDRPFSSLLVRVRPGTPAAFEEVLLDRLQRVAPEWTFSIDTLEDMRASNHRLRLLPVVAAGTVAAFLILMVALGLMGVLWQNVTRRTQEFGLRRAAGSTAARVRSQILLEVVLLVTLGAGLATILVAQLPLLGLLAFLNLDLTVFLYALAASAALLYTIALLSALYPSWLATRIHPAQALSYE